MHACCQVCMFASLTLVVLRQLPVERLSQNVFLGLAGELFCCSC